MDNYEKNYLSKRPQSLCSMCGRCCRVSTTSVPYARLLEMCEAGEETAMDFLGIFEPYSSTDAAREVDAELVDNVINQLKACNNYDESNMTFYRCKYIRDDNLCGNYENRPLLCHYFPGSAWAVVPPGCGFEGWLLWKREEDKQKIRHSKEQLLELQVLKCRNLTPEFQDKAAEVEKKIQKTIDMYKKYGSEFW
ncbi:MAG: YkgJ family cysteine cluster protein [Heliobacteriaceae bacterium]|jgi:Fe-S-cluster containining protein|nr:YkgJ family cysteine cluster protein [Heliobacteriaceae bacterium]